MLFIKSIILILILVLSSILGLAMANKFKCRVRDLKTMRNILNILETKIKYTYEPLPQIFDDIAKEFNSPIGEIFKVAKDKMKEVSAGEAWNFGLVNSNTSMNKEDINVLKNLEKLLGKTNVEGQLSEIELMKRYIDIQTQKAAEEDRKNEKLYKNLGIILGLAIVIILI